MKRVLKSICILCVTLTVLLMGARLHAQTIDWKTDGSVEVTGSHTFTSPLKNELFRITEDSMVLVDMNVYEGQEQQVDYGIFGKGDKSELRVYHRKKRNAVPVNDTYPFGFDFTNNDYLIYGCKAEHVPAFQNKADSWKAYGYYKHGYSFSKSHIQSTDYKHLWNRPKSATWWDTVADVAAVVFVVALVVFTLGVAAELAGPALAGYELVGSAAEAIAYVATTYTATLSVILISGNIAITAHLYGELAVSDKQTPLVPQPVFESQMEMPMPSKVANATTKAQKQYNKAIDDLAKHAFPCQNFLGINCFRSNIKEVAVQLEVNNAHVKHVNIPGELISNLTPYQLFKNYSYVVEAGSKVNLLALANLTVINSADHFDQTMQVLPKKVAIPDRNAEVTIELEGYHGIKYFYIVAKELPADFLLPNTAHATKSKFYKDLGVYATRQSETYRLFRLSLAPTTKGHPRFTFTTGPDGPFLAGDNIVLKQPMDELKAVYENPNAHPDYIMLAAHRGYWRYAPENSLEAFEAAADLGVDMVEIDLKMTYDNQIIVAHDFHLGRLTTVPDALKVDAFKKTVNGVDRLLLGKMKLCDIRPDLCDPANAQNANYCGNCEHTAGVNNTKKLKLIRPNGQVGEKVPTLREAFDALRDKPVLINLDKIDPGSGVADSRYGGQIQQKTFFFDSIYLIAQEKGMLDRVIVKQRVDKFSPAELRASSVVDWSQWYYTPTAFADNTCPNYSSEGTLTSCLSEYFDNAEAGDDPAKHFKSPGVELIYLREQDGAYPSTYNYLRGQNKRVIQFPQYPENSEGVWNPKKYVFSDIDPRLDKRNDWSWLLETNRKPDLIISDRLEVLFELLEQLGYRNKNS